MDAVDNTFRNAFVSDSIQKAPLYCICRSSIINVDMIMCDFCEEWYHFSCIGMTRKKASKIDKFCCKECKTKNSESRTTYKKVNRKNIKCKHKIPKHKNSASKNFQKSSDLVSKQNSNASSIMEAEAVNKNDVAKNKCFDFVDTTIRKAKTEAYEKFKRQSITAQLDKVVKASKEKTELKQCYGPGCTRASRKNSKYCSDACGILLAKHRLVEILPQRIQQWNSSPSAADELSRKKLADIRAKLHDIQNQLENLDIEIIRLLGRISKSKDPRNYFVEIQCDDTSTMDCMLCGAEIQNRYIERHLEMCYAKLEKKITTDDKIKPNDDKWNIFCNRKMGRNSWCKKMKVLCPLHYKNSRKADEVCGYTLGEENGVIRYCGNKNRTCSHINWEELQRAELDLKKLNLLLKFKDLKSEEENIRREMSRRGDVLSLMCNYTIEH